MQYKDVECEEDRLVMMNTAKIGRFFTIVYLSLSYTGALPYHIILPLISERIVKEDNTTQIPLPYLSDYVFFVIEDSPIYEMTFVLQIFISSIILSTNCGTYSLIASITMHCCGLFEVTNRKIETLCKWNNRDLHDRVIDIVQSHLKAIEYSARVGESLSIVFLSEMLGCTIIICFLEFGVIMELEDHKTLSTVTYFVLMTSIFVNVFIISFIGDRLKQEMEIQYRDVECEEDRLVMMNTAKIGRIFTIVYLFLGYGGALPYHIILPLISERIVKADNSTQIPLPYLSDYVFFVIEDSPTYEITFVVQMFTSFLIMSLNYGIYSLIASITMHCCGLFEVTNRRIETILKNRDLRSRIVNIIQSHLKAIEYSARVGKSLSIVFLSEMLGCTIIICFLEFGVIVEWEDHKTFSMVTYFVLVTSMFVNVFILSFIGDRLKQESERIGQTSYFLPWYDFPTEVAKNIRIIILRASRPSSLSGAKMLDLSLRVFCDHVSYMFHRIQHYCGLYIANKDDKGKLEYFYDEQYLFYFRNGKIIILLSNNLAQTCITLNWYRFPKKKARYLILIIIMSNYPIKLTAAKVMDISLTTFTDVMKAAVGYLNMLREVT
ncbi:Odorant receptor 49b [Apis cerana cerana]|uniref:Odorant receptor 49b n=1 Tax=Apis cerana cerana TaxID=94128 RepID=A0A2A3ES49_APICC|nr:Odorant receptor 49b [Apis cerana cerana]